MEEEREKDDSIEILEKKEQRLVLSFCYVRDILYMMIKYSYGTYKYYTI